MTGLHKPFFHRNKYSINLWLESFRKWLNRETDINNCKWSLTFKGERAVKVSGIWRSGPFKAHLALEHWDWSLIQASIKFKCWQTHCLSKTLDELLVLIIFPSVESLYVLNSYNSGPQSKWSKRFWRWCIPFSTFMTLVASAICKLQLSLSVA